MIPKLLLVVLISLCTLCNIYAQQTAISGQITTQSGSPLAGATVYLNHSVDSNLIKIAITNTDGYYEIGHVKAGKYFISASFNGYTKNSTISFAVTENKKNDVPNLILLLAGKNIQEIIVTGSRQKPTIEVTAGKTIFNVEGSINATGSNAFELLQKSPGITTDNEDNLSMKGKTGVLIYIDGRITQMHGPDLAGYLKSINSAEIEAIEMISNPSARYDAAGNAGIINIRLKKNNTIGLSAALIAGLNFGKHLKTNEAISLNYRNKNVNLFSNYSYNYGSNDNTFDMYRVQNDTIYDQKSNQNIKGSTQNVKAGVDFFISKISTIGIIYTGNFTNNTTFSYSRTPSSAINTGNIDKILYATNTIPANIKNQNVNANYRYADTAGHELNIDIDHGFYESRKTSYQPNNYFTPPPETFIYEKNYRNNTPINIAINTQKIDYVTPLKNGKLSMGAKISHVKTDNKFILYNVVGGQDTIDLKNCNLFLYKENVNAGYVSYFTPLSRKLHMQAGLRVENTVTNSKLTRFDQVMRTLGEDSIHRNYTDFFPSLAFTFAMDSNNNFDLSYSRRIDRPNYIDLNPFETRVDELNFIKGNPYLRPQYTNSIQLTHTFKNKYITSVNYSHISDFSTYIIDTAKINQNYVSKKNVGNEDIASINFSVPIDVTKWWNVYSSVIIYNSRYHANTGTERAININITSFNINAENSFRLGHGFTTQLSAYYGSPFISLGTFKSKAQGFIDIGLQKKIWHDDATIKISCTDILHTLKWQGESHYDGTHIIASSTWETKQLRLNFTYRFGRTQVKQSRQRSTGNEDESQRASGGGGLNN
ncbi:MAG: TonB-dependent receptor [Ferruginibacter sp.]|nr:TonB-dependent receptor [Ferruginibacter sp.]